MNPNIIKRPILKRGDVQLAEPGAPLPSTTAPAAVAVSRHVVRKTATIVEEAGRPVAIHVTCSCGESTILELDFDNPEAPRTEGKPA